MAQDVRVRLLSSHYLEAVERGKGFTMSTMSFKPTTEQAKVSSVLDEEGIIRKILVFNRVASTKEMYTGGIPYPNRTRNSGTITNYFC